MARSNLLACAIAGGLLLNVTAGAEAQQSRSWCLIDDQSQITFTGRQTGRTFQGHFNQFSADIVFDPDNLAASSVTVTIEMASVDAGDKDRNEALPNAEWFHTEKYPTATFTADQFRHTDATSFNARGSLTIRGITNAITLPFTLGISDDLARAKGAVTIDRRDFSIGQGMWTSDRWVAYPVEIGIDVAAELCTP